MDSADSRIHVKSAVTGGFDALECAVDDKPETTSLSATI